MEYKKQKMICTAVSIKNSSVLLQNDAGQESWCKLAPEAAKFISNVQKGDVWVDYNKEKGLVEFIKNDNFGTVQRNQYVPQTDQRQQAIQKQFAFREALTACIACRTDQTADKLIHAAKVMAEQNIIPWLEGKEDAL